MATNYAITRAQKQTILRFYSTIQPLLHEVDVQLDTLASSTANFGPSLSFHSSNLNLVTSSTLPFFATSYSNGQFDPSVGTVWDNDGTAQDGQHKQHNDHILPHNSLQPTSSHPTSANPTPTHPNPSKTSNSLSHQQQHRSIYTFASQDDTTNDKNPHHNPNLTATDPLSTPSHSNARQSYALSRMESSSRISSPQTQLFLRSPTSVSLRLPASTQSNILLSTVRLAHQRRYEALDYLRTSEGVLRARFNALSILKQVVAVAITRIHSVLTNKIDNLRNLVKKNTTLIASFRALLQDTETYNQQIAKRLHEANDKRTVFEHKVTSFEWSSPHHFFLAAFSHYSGRFVRPHLLHDVINAIPSHLRLAAMCHSQVLSIVRLETIVALGTQSISYDYEFIDLIDSYNTKLSLFIEYYVSLHNHLLSTSIDTVTEVLSSITDSELLLCNSSRYYLHLIRSILSPLEPTDPIQAQVQAIMSPQLPSSQSWLNANLFNGAGNTMGSEGGNGVFGGNHVNNDSFGHLVNSNFPQSNSNLNYNMIVQPGIPLPITPTTPCSAQNDTNHTNTHHNNSNSNVPQQHLSLPSLPLNTLNPAIAQQPTTPGGLHVKPLPAIGAALATIPSPSLIEQQQLQQQHHSSLFQQHQHEHSNNRYCPHHSSSSYHHHHQQQHHHHQSTLSSTDTSSTLSSSSRYHPHNHDHNHNDSLSHYRPSLDSSPGSKQYYVEHRKLGLIASKLLSLSPQLRLCHPHSLPLYMLISPAQQALFHLKNVLNLPCVSFSCCFSGDSKQCMPYFYRNQIAAHNRAQQQQQHDQQQLMIMKRNQRNAKNTNKGEDQSNNTTANASLLPLAQTASSIPLTTVLSSISLSESSSVVLMAQNNSNYQQHQAPTLSIAGVPLTAGGNPELITNRSNDGDNNNTSTPSIKITKQPLNLTTIVPTSPTAGPHNGMIKLTNHSAQQPSPHNGQVLSPVIEPTPRAGGTRPRAGTFAMTPMSGSGIGQNVFHNTKFKHFFDFFYPYQRNNDYVSLLDVIQNTPPARSPLEAFFYSHGVDLNERDRDVKAFGPLLTQFKQKLRLSYSRRPPLATQSSSSSSSAQPLLSPTLSPIPSGPGLVMMQNQSQVSNSAQHNNSNNNNNSNASNTSNTSTNAILIPPQSISPHPSASDEKNHSLPPLTLLTQTNSMMKTPSSDSTNVVPSSTGATSPQQHQQHQQHQHQQQSLKNTPSGAFQQNPPASLGPIASSHSVVAASPSHSTNPNHQLTNFEQQHSKEVMDLFRRERDRKNALFKMKRDFLRVFTHEYHASQRGASDYHQLPVPMMMPASASGGTGMAPFVCEQCSHNNNGPASPPTSISSQFLYDYNSTPSNTVSYAHNNINYSMLVNNQRSFSGALGTGGSSQPSSYNPSHPLPHHPNPLQLAPNQPSHRIQWADNVPDTFLDTQPKVCCAIQHNLRERIFKQKELLTFSHSILASPNPPSVRHQFNGNSGDAGAGGDEGHNGLYTGSGQRHGDFPTLSSHPSSLSSHSFDHNFNYTNDSFSNIENASGTHGSFYADFTTKFNSTSLPKTTSTDHIHPLNTNMLELPAQISSFDSSRNTSSPHNNHNSNSPFSYHTQSPFPESPSSIPLTPIILGDIKTESITKGNHGGANRAKTNNSPTSTLSPVALTPSEPIEFPETLPNSLSMAMTPFTSSVQKDKGGGGDDGGFSVGNGNESQHHSFSARFTSYSPYSNSPSSISTFFHQKTAALSIPSTGTLESSVYTIENYDPLASIPTELLHMPCIALPPSILAHGLKKFKLHSYYESGIAGLLNEQRALMVKEYEDEQEKENRFVANSNLAKNNTQTNVDYVSDLTKNDQQSVIGSTSSSSSSSILQPNQSTSSTSLPQSHFVLPSLSLSPTAMSSTSLHHTGTAISPPNQPLQSVFKHPCRGHSFSTGPANPANPVGLFNETFPDLYKGPRNPSSGTNNNINPKTSNNNNPYGRSLSGNNIDNKSNIMSQKELDYLYSPYSTRAPQQVAMYKPSSRSMMLGPGLTTGLATTLMHHSDDEKNKNSEDDDDDDDDDVAAATTEGNSGEKNGTSTSNRTSALPPPPLPLTPTHFPSHLTISPSIPLHNLYQNDQIMVPTGATTVSTPCNPSHRYHRDAKRAPTLLQPTATKRQMPFPFGSQSPPSPSSSQSGNPRPKPQYTSRQALVLQYNHVNSAITQLEHTLLVAAPISSLTFIPPETTDTSPSTLVSSQSNLTAEDLMNAAKEYEDGGQTTPHPTTFTVDPRDHDPSDSALPFSFLHHLPIASTSPTALPLPPTPNNNDPKNGTLDNSSGGSKSRAIVMGGPNTSSPPSSSLDLTNPASHRPNTTTPSYVPIVETGALEKLRGTSPPKTHDALHKFNDTNLPTGGDGYNTHPGGPNLNTGENHTGGLDLHSPEEVVNEALLIQNKTRIDNAINGATNNGFPNQIWASLSTQQKNDFCIKNQISSLLPSPYTKDSSTALKSPSSLTTQSSSLSPQSHSGELSTGTLTPSPSSSTKSLSRLRPRQRRALFIQAHEGTPVLDANSLFPHGFGDLGDPLTIPNNTQDSLYVPPFPLPSVPGMPVVAMASLIDSDSDDEGSLPKIPSPKPPRTTLAANSCCPQPSTTAQSLIGEQVPLASIDEVTFFNVSEHPAMQTLLSLRTQLQQQLREVESGIVMMGSDLDNWSQEEGGSTGPGSSQQGNKPHATFNSHLSSINNNNNNTFRSSIAQPPPPSPQQSFGAFTPQFPPNLSSYPSGTTPAATATNYSSYHTSHNGSGNNGSNNNNNSNMKPRQQPLGSVTPTQIGQIQDTIGFLLQSVLFQDIDSAIQHYVISSISTPHLMLQQSISSLGANGHLGSIVNGSLGRNVSGNTGGLQPPSTLGMRSQSTHFDNMTSNPSNPTTFNDTFFNANNNNRTSLGATAMASSHRAANNTLLPSQQQSRYHGLPQNQQPQQQHHDTQPAVLFPTTANNINNNQSSLSLLSDLTTAFNPLQQDPSRVRGFSELLITPRSTQSAVDVLLILSSQCSKQIDLCWGQLERVILQREQLLGVLDEIEMDGCRSILMVTPQNGSTTTPR